MARRGAPLSPRSRNPRGEANAGEGALRQQHLGWSFLRDFRILDLARRIARDAVTLQRTKKIKLLDAIIWASARAESALLVTRNTRDFPEADPGVRIPYRI